MKRYMCGILNKTAIVTLLACMMLSCREEYQRVIPELNVEGEFSHDVPREGGVYYLTVTASEQFTAPSTKIWCKTEILSTEGVNNVKITVEPNNGYLRDAEVAIVVYSLPGVKVTIHQDGDDPDVVVPAGPHVTGSWPFSSASNPG
ncbi:MAG: BACON domain-containing protein, partial [Tannerella sp.]|nr:BACON domain-containing protein [Tannerella sp.]